MVLIKLVQFGLYLPDINEFNVSRGFGALFSVHVEQHSGFVGTTSASFDLQGHCSQEARSQDPHHGHNQELNQTQNEISLTGPLVYRNAPRKLYASGIKICLPRRWLC